MFKKPKRNFRARDFQGDDNEEGDDKVETDPPAQKLQVPKKAAKEKKAETVKQSMLSFGEDWDEGEFESDDHFMDVIQNLWQKFTSPQSGLIVC